MPLYVAGKSLDDRGMTQETAFSSSASRSRRYRQRRREGVFVVPVEVGAPALNGLVRYGLIDADNVTRDEISFALEILLDAVSKGAIDLDENWIDSFGD